MGVEIVLVATDTGSAGKNPVSVTLQVSYLFNCYTHACTHTHTHTHTHTQSY